MTALFSDTNPKIEQMQIEIIRRMPSWKKFAIVDDLNETVKPFALSGIKQCRPDSSAEQSGFCWPKGCSVLSLPIRCTAMPGDSIRVMLLVTDVLVNGHLLCSGRLSFKLCALILLIQIHARID